MQGCHLISAYCDYLFKTPSDTLAVQQSKGGRANKEKGRRNTRETTGETVQISPYSLRGGDIRFPSNSEHCLHL